MIKSCKRCENEAALPGLPIGKNCVERARQESAEYERLLTEPQEARLERRVAELQKQIAPLALELQEVTLALGEIRQQREVAEEAARLELEAIADLEAAEAVRKLEEEIAAARAELEDGSQPSAVSSQPSADSSQPDLAAIDELLPQVATLDPEVLRALPDAKDDDELEGRIAALAGEIEAEREKLEEGASRKAQGASTDPDPGAGA